MLREALDQPAASAPLLDLRLPAVPGVASDVRRAVHEVAADEVADGYAVALAATEAVTNVIVHAYRDRAPGADPGHMRDRDGRRR